MNKSTTTTWQQYEAGKDFKRRIGLYETVRRNERFYRGDQWHGSTGDLPHPVFNLIRRVTDFLVDSVAPGDVSFHYSDERLPFLDRADLQTRIREGLGTLERSAAYRWKRDRMRELSEQALLDAAISGDGIFYCWWDDSVNDGQPYRGDIRTDLIDNTNLFVSDVNNPDIQSQEHLILSGRATVSSLRMEALEAGLPAREVEKIVGDRETETQAGDFSAFELDGAEKATYLIRFFREDGQVVFEKSTRSCVLRRVNTGLRYYPVAYFSWNRVKNSFHGNAPVSDLIANQKYINTAYAMVMKHMTDTAFSKIIYDKSRIPEWSNEVGEAIAAQGGGNVADAVSVVGVGQMQDGYLDLISNVIETTKEMMGATDAALGDERANNTSAILALQDASRVSLFHIESAFSRCLADLASIWADMLCNYCPPGRMLSVPDGDGVRAEAPDYSLLRGELLRATAEASAIGWYSPSTTVALLDRLLDEHYLDVRQYLELLPQGTVTDREALLSQVSPKGASCDE